MTNQWVCPSTTDVLTIDLTAVFHCHWQNGFMTLTTLISLWNGSIQSYRNPFLTKNPHSKGHLAWNWRQCVAVVALSKLLSSAKRSDMTQNKFLLTVLLDKSFFQLWLMLPTSPSRGKKEKWLFHPVFWASFIRPLIAWPLASLIGFSAVSIYRTAPPLCLHSATLIVNSASPIAVRAGADCAHL